MEGWETYVGYMTGIWDNTNQVYKTTNCSAEAAIYETESGAFTAGTPGFEFGEFNIEYELEDGTVETETVNEWATVQACKRHILR